MFSTPHCAHTLPPFLCHFLQDERFNCEIDSLTGYRTKALLCMPIKDSGGDVIGVAQVINKMNGECFSEIDEKVSALDLNHRVCQLQVLCFSHTHTSTDTLTHAVGHTQREGQAKWLPHVNCIHYLTKGKA